MTGHRPIAVTFAALLALGVSVASALAAANPGGAAPGVLTLPDGSQLVVRLGNPLVRASGNGIALALRSTAMLRGRARISGTAAPGAGGITIERHDDVAGWVAIASAAVATDGRFTAIWHPDRSGPLKLRAVRGSTAAGTAVQDPALDPSAPQLDLTVYQPGIASWYGATSRGATTACGVPLRRWTLGVAHRTLPCGTPVAFYYKGRTVVVPVIDRGPFVKGRSWDLTRATHEALGGDDGLIRVGALPLLPPAAPARSAR
ncbi:MAG TPA: septal ring lytic transglycosylase RlpA family protein [Conexibacter sp.]|jgi:rare lipoprotein A|nr:septal ring lytic transglycosylase RlpA family protein [Conexibacter sp.]